MNTIELAFAVRDEARDILIAQLSAAGCSGFQETDELLLCYVGEDDSAIEVVLDVAQASGYDFRRSVMPAQNWNATWEAGFAPVVVPGFCTVRAPFHSPAHDTPYEIVMMPKMAFGTGHHATTRLMMQAMQGTMWEGQRVLDFGTGTGILAILAMKLGAAMVHAIDIDEWSIANAREHFEANGSSAVRLSQGSIDDCMTGEQFDVILANINRNVLLESMAAMHRSLRAGGILLLSGILEADQKIIFGAATDVGFRLCESFNDAGWMCLKFTA